MKVLFLGRVYINSLTLLTYRLALLSRKRNVIYRLSVTHLELNLRRFSIILLSFGCTKLVLVACI